MNLSLDSVQLLVAVADSGSFSAAARQLGKAQSAVSTAIAHLEVDLGLTLFDRSGRLPRLTAHGERMLAEARALLAQQGQWQAVAAELAAGVEPRADAGHRRRLLLPWLAPVLQISWHRPTRSWSRSRCSPLLEDLSDMVLSRPRPAGRRCYQAPDHTAGPDALWPWPDADAAGGTPASVGPARRTDARRSTASAAR